MTLTSSQRLERLQQRAQELEFWRARQTAYIDGWSFDGQDIAIGAAWPRKDGAVNFACAAEAPLHWPLGETRLVLNVGGESLITITDADGAGKSYGLDPYHHEFPLPSRNVRITTESV